MALSTLLIVYRFQSRALFRERIVPVSPAVFLSEGLCNAADPLFVVVLGMIGSFFSFTGTIVAVVSFSSPYVVSIACFVELGSIVSFGNAFFFFFLGFFGFSSF